MNILLPISLLKLKRTVFSNKQTSNMNQGLISGTVMTTLCSDYSKMCSDELNIVQRWILPQFSWKHLNSYVFRERQMNAFSHFQWKYAWHYLNVTGNLTHFTKFKSPLYSSFQHNFRNNIQFRHYWEEKWDYCQTKASKRNELEISIQRLEAKRKITFYETVGCKIVLE